MDICRLIEAALLARQKAYTPYSGYQVGAALLAEHGDIYPGCNVENAAFQAGCCAERTALFSAVADGQRHFSAIAITGGPSGESPPLAAYAYPCGICRQALAEFAPDLRVIVAQDTAHYEIHSLGELLPNAFTPASLGQNATKEEPGHAGIDPEN